MSGSIYDILSPVSRLKSTCLARFGVALILFGMVMPGTIVLKQKYQQEFAPKVAMDRGENISVTETVVTPAGTFKNCLKVEETSPLDEKHRAMISALSR